MVDLPFVAVACLLQFFNRLLLHLVAFRQVSETLSTLVQLLLEKLVGSLVLVKVLLELDEVSVEEFL